MRKNVLEPWQSLVAGDMSGDLTSATTDVRHMDNMSVLVTWSGSVDIAGRVDAQFSHNSTGPWLDVGMFPIPTVTGASGSLILNLNQVPSPYFRVAYYRTTGTGTLNISIAGKMI